MDDLVFAAVEKIIKVNFPSVVSLLSHFAPYFESLNRPKSRSSPPSRVIGGKCRNLVYASAKGGLSIYLQGLRNRLHFKGVSVITIKPGDVDTPMTSHLRKGPLFVGPKYPCSAPLKSSHPGCLLRAVFNRASVPERLMRPLMVVPLHPLSNNPPRLVERWEDMLTDALLFETPKEPHNDPVLFRRIRRDEFLLQAVISTGLPESATLEDQAVAAAQDRRADGAERPEPGEAGRFDRAVRLFCATPTRELIANDLAIVTVDHCGQMRPAFFPTGNVCHIHRPPFVAPTGATHPAPHAGARR